MAIVLTSLIGCKISEEEKIKDANEAAADHNVIVIDSCEYVTFRTYGGTVGFSHKGNCKYCRAWAEKH